ncbi:capsule polysaccharide biosynthesis protein [Pestalotiopsis sp. NC0098]|nr:capsule polysaccharide biosynthesis protein [Pestalotiopsis sp. NC0098]
MGDLSSSFTIPKEYEAELEYVKDISDHRSDAEIFESLSQYSPVTSEKTIWGFWDAGFTKMPFWCQRNVIGWVRINPGWTVRILDNLPDSPHYALKYVGADLLPKVFVERRMDGPTVGAHSADLLRGACLYMYGGAWLDVGAILMRGMDGICWDTLEDPNTPFRVAAPLVFDQAAGNHFFAARKGDPFIKHWHDLFCYLWTDKTNVDGMRNHPILRDTNKRILEQYKIIAPYLWDWSVPHEKALEYVTQISVWAHLCHNRDAGDGFDGCAYWENHIFLFSSKEDWPAEEMLGFAGSGQKIMDLLALRRDGDRDSDQYKMAESLVWTLLARTCMQKVTHAAGITHSPHLGTLWDMPENEGKDCAPGTFGELLRYGAVHFRQKRETVPRMPAPKPLPENTFKRGLFEA